MNQLDDITRRVQEWVNQTFPLAQERQVGLHDSLLDSGIIDSLGTLEVVRFLEEGFEIQVSDDEMVADNFETMHSIAQFAFSKSNNVVAQGKGR